MNLADRSVSRSNANVVVSNMQSPEAFSRGRARVKYPEPSLTVQSRPSSLSPPMSPNTYSSRSRAGSAASSYRTNATSMLPALQTKGAGDEEILEPLAEEEVEPGSFDLVVPSHGDSGQHYDLEDRSELIFSKDHLQAIFRDHIQLQRFTDFLHSVRPDSLPLLSYYLDCLKALRAISYANAITDGLDTLPEHDFSTDNSYKTVNTSLEKKAEAAFDVLVQQDLPAYVTHIWIQTVTVSISKRITGTLPVQLKEMSEGLAEVFCLTDPSRHDNPIIFASEGMILLVGLGHRPVISADSVGRVPQNNTIRHETCHWPQLSLPPRSEDKSFQCEADSREASRRQRTL